MSGCDQRVGAVSEWVWPASEWPVSGCDQRVGAVRSVSGCGQRVSVASESV